MFAPLANALFEKGLLTVDIEVEINFDTTTLGGLTKLPTIGCFMIQSINKINEELIITGANVRDGSNQNINVEQIIKIDGMDPERFASVYNVNCIGMNLKMGKQRGRKPKIRLIGNEQEITKFNNENNTDY